MLITVYVSVALLVPAAYVSVYVWVTFFDTVKTAYFQEGIILYLQTFGLIIGLWMTTSSYISALAATKAQKVAFFIVTYPWFQRTVIALIVLNSVLLAFDSPTIPCEFCNKFEELFLISFTLECALKMTAFGVYQHKTAYLRSGWNIMDFAIVVIDWMYAIIGDSLHFASVLRVGRCLRPLRSLTRIPILQMMVTAILDTIPHLGPVLLFSGLLFWFFGGLAMIYLGTTFDQRCMLPGNVEIDANTMVNLYKEQVRKCSTNPARGHQCPVPFVCIKEEENDAINFNSLAGSSLSIFQIMTLDWTLLSSWGQDVAGNTIFIFFVFLVMWFAYILRKMLVAVVMANFSSACAAAYEIDVKVQEEAAKRFDKALAVVEDEIRTRKNAVNKHKLLAMLEGRTVSAVEMLGIEIRDLLVACRLCISNNEAEYTIQQMLECKVLVPFGNSLSQAIFLNLQEYYIPASQASSLLPAFQASIRSGVKQADKNLMIGQMNDFEEQSPLRMAQGKQTNSVEGDTLMQPGKSSITLLDRKQLLTINITAVTFKLSY